MSAADMIVAGVEVESEMNELRPFTVLLVAIESCSTLGVPAAGLRVILSMLICAASSAIDVHQDVPLYADDVARLRSFVAHLDAATFEIRQEPKGGL